MTIQPSRAYRTHVRAVHDLSPTFRRLTLTGTDLVHFGTGGLDQRIKLLLPLADGRITDIGLFDDPPPSLTDWYRRWRELPDELRNPLRTYTVRAVRPADREIDIDFALHGSDGPASAWALSVHVGEELLVIGPDGRSDIDGGGIEWKRGEAGTVLIAGDETAAPAICSILESLPEHVSGDAFIEVPTADDALVVRTSSRVEIHWLPREEADMGAELIAAVRAWGAARAKTDPGAGTTSEVDLPEPNDDVLLWDVADAGGGDFYAWLAGEAGCIKQLRRHLVRDLGIDRAAVSFMGYWRQGRAESA